MMVMAPLLISAAMVVSGVIGRAMALRATETTYLARLNDANALADVAEVGLRGGTESSMRSKLQRYEQVFGANVVLFDSDVQVLATSGTIDGRTTALLVDAAEEALTGVRADSAPVVLPWRTAPMLVAAPVGDDRRVDGAIVIAWPTDEVRADLLRRWLLVLVVMSAGLVAFVALARPLIRWVLRPVVELDEAAHSLADGDLDARVPATSGPPELRRLAGGFNEMADALTDAMQRERAFAADASHHIGNVLTSLRLRVELLDHHVDGEGVALQRDALHEVDRMGTIIDQLLHMAHAEGARSALAEVDVVAEVEERVEMWRDAADAAGSPIRLSAPTSLAALTIDGTVAKAVDLLLDNACKYAPGTHIDVVVATRGTDAVVEVTDGGDGMSDEEMASATGRFWCAGLRQNLPGSGLGLAVVAGLVESSGGTLSLERCAAGGLMVRLAFAVPVASSANGSNAVRQGAVPGAR
jgi:signal transduction histidine kinase